jgi:hypothetical protein
LEPSEVDRRGKGIIAGEKGVPLTARWKNAQPH